MFNNIPPKYTKVIEGLGDLQSEVENLQHTNPTDHSLDTLIGEISRLAFSLKKSVFTEEEKNALLENLQSFENLTKHLENTPPFQTHLQILFKRINKLRDQLNSNITDRSFSFKAAEQDALRSFTFKTQQDKPPSLKIALSDDEEITDEATTETENSEWESEIEESDSDISQHEIEEAFDEEDDEDWNDENPFSLPRDELRDRAEAPAPPSIAPVAVPAAHMGAAAAGGAAPLAAPPNVQVAAAQAPQQPQVVVNARPAPPVPAPPSRWSRFKDFYNKYLATPLIILSGVLMISAAVVAFAFPPSAAVIGGSLMGAALVIFVIWTVMAVIQLFATANEIDNFHRNIR